MTIVLNNNSKPRMAKANGVSSDTDYIATAPSHGQLETIEKAFGSARGESEQREPAHSLTPKPKKKMPNSSTPVGRQHVWKVLTHSHTPPWNR